ncbi:hypothetical protein AQJ91_41455 [Streptomyces dysideae]|uniref:Uncharacterized protein n=1 Tax=Streptomyces dysideae TaxID=909626 RepID=A0A101UR86_9ACTN|nr:hypothetical protein AQJ91_41455 [Streptomyces dysideae]
MTRRTFLSAGAASAASALPIVPGFSGLLSQAFAADTQTNLSKMVDMRFGMFNHFGLGTFTNQEWAEPNQSATLFAPPSVNCAQWADAAVRVPPSAGSGFHEVSSGGGANRDTRRPENAVREGYLHPANSRAVNGGAA